MSIQFSLSAVTLLIACTLLLTSLPGVLECAAFDHKLSNITRTDTLLNLSEQVSDTSELADELRRNYVFELC